MTAHAAEPDTDFRLAGVVTFLADLWTTAGGQTRAVAWAPADRPRWGFLGTLAISVNGRAKRYRVGAVHAPQAPGLVYRLVEVGTGKISQVLLGADQVGCDCEAGSYRRHEPQCDGCTCKHGSAVVAVREAGLLPHPADSPLGPAADPEALLFAAS
jgi:hypothetical protein